MSEEFNWLEYSEEMEAAALEEEGRSGRRGLRRLLPRLPSLRRPALPRMPGIPRPRLPKLRLPSLRRRGGARESHQPSAADILGEQLNRPLEDLDDRLRALRERSVEASQPAPSHQALYAVDDLLAGPALQDRPGGVISAVSLSKAQQQQVEMLRDVVGGAPEAANAGGRSPRFFSGFALSAAPRLLGSAVLLLAVSLPFVSSDYAEGDLPPAEFHEDRHEPTTFYNLLDNLTGDDYVLVAFEYGPAAAGELDILADLLLRHILAQRAKPIIVSSNPIAIVHAQNVIRAINRSLDLAGEQLLHGEDYFLLRYLPGGALGLRELSENFDDVARISAKGLPTGLQFDTLDEMTEIVLIAASADDIRHWVEQVASAAEGRRLLVATSYAAQPLAQAYADSLDQVIGPIVGIRDAYTYGQKLETNFGALLPAEASPQEPEFEQLDADASSDSQAEGRRGPELPAEDAIATALPQPTETAPPTATYFATDRPQPTDTPAPRATDSPTATATATEAPVRVVVVTSGQRVNIRRGPTTVDDILGLGYEGDMFEVIGANGDGSWYEILLPGGVEGWIAEFLVDERLVSAAELAGAQASASAADTQRGERAVLQREYMLRLGKPAPRFYQAQAPASGDRLEVALNRDRAQEIPRLEAMTLGTLAAALAIIFGNVIYAARALLSLRGTRGD